MGKTYGDVQIGETVNGAGGEVTVDSIENQPNGLVVFRGTRPNTGEPASTWGWSDDDVPGQ